MSGKLRKMSKNHVKSASPDTEECFIQCKRSKDFSCNQRSDLKIPHKVLLNNKQYDNHMQQQGAKVRDDGATFTGKIVENTIANADRAAGKTKDIRCQYVIVDKDINEISPKKYKLHS